MSIKAGQLRDIEDKIRLAVQKEGTESKAWKRAAWRAYRWAGMLWHEWIRDDLAIRAESLSYFTLFAIMPVVAGLFLLIGVLSEWSPIQNDFENLLSKLIEPLPPDHQRLLLSYVMDFKDQYLFQLHQKSATLGIFALAVLLWIVVKVFMNIEDLMNRIWSVYENRDWFGRLQNFTFCSVIFPSISIVALSLPGLIEHFAGKKVGLLVQSVIPISIIFLSLTFVFRYLPNAKVAWKSAAIGAGFSTISSVVLNWGLHFYFRFATNSAYGKLGVIPVLAFFIYILWINFILGAEVSFVSQNQQRFSGAVMPQSTLAEAALVVEALRLMHLRFEKGEKLLTPGDLAAHFQVPIDAAMKVIILLTKKGVLVLTLQKSRSADANYALTTDLRNINLGELIKEYLKIGPISQHLDIAAVMSLVAEK